MEDLAELYHATHDETFTEPSFDLYIGTASIVLSKKSGIELTLVDVNINDQYELRTASVKMSKRGIELHAMFEGNLEIH